MGRGSGGARLRKPEAGRRPLRTRFMNAYRKFCVRLKSQIAGHIKPIGVCSSRPCRLAPTTISLQARFPRNQKEDEERWRALANKTFDSAFFAATPGGRVSILATSGEADVISLCSRAKRRALQNLGSHLFLSLR